MLTMKSIMSITKSEYSEVAKTLTEEDVSQLIEWLSLKDDNIRYNALLLLQIRSALFSDVYLYWSILQNKLKSDNSYQRSIGLLLLVDNVKWDKEKRMEGMIDQFLMLLDDEKPITIRQCIQALGKIVEVKPNLNDKVAAKMIDFDLMSVKETMRKSILLDILNVLLIIRKEQSTDEIECYIVNALKGNLLNNKSKKKIETYL
ncbi:MAG: hypothetical protein PHP11_05145 [Erysipelotrichaceae bacterium]|nr:hypothetical protein [Erysipelotrichaceae bacterium]MDD3924466.1 hypothetical protein [Erysipelotrichaceae bacterium]